MNILRTTFTAPSRLDVVMRTLRTGFANASETSIPTIYNRFMTQDSIQPMCAFNNRTMLHENRMLERMNQAIAKAVIKTPRDDIEVTLGKQVNPCGSIVLYLAQPKSDMEPPVFHMQHSAVGRFINTGCGMAGRRVGLSTSQSLTLGASLFLSCLTTNMAVAKDKPCLNYYTVGESNCRPSASTPVAGASERSAPMPTRQNEQTAVDKYLSEYGKPPREFVEFYLNPTPENATKWVAAYQQILQKGQDMSKAWSEADQLYKAGLQSPEPVSQAPASFAPEPMLQTMPQAPAQPLSQAAPASFGGIADRIDHVKNAPSGIAPNQTSLTYYYSQTGPYCVRMTPDLAILSREMSSKLAFTCVDVTPVGPDIRPNQSYITSKLPCEWRLPEQGEVDREGVRQTPTLVIQKPGAAKVRLSGYVPLTQLRTYF